MALFRVCRWSAGSEQEEQQEESQGQEEWWRSAAGEGGEPGDRCTLCHCPSTHGSGAGRAVEELRGWGMLSWVQGEGKRVGEHPPTHQLDLLCLGTRNLSGTVGVETCGTTGVRTVWRQWIRAGLLAAELQFLCLKNDEGSAAGGAAADLVAVPLFSGKCQYPNLRSPHNRKFLLQIL